MEYNPDFSKYVYVINIYNVEGKEWIESHYGEADSHEIARQDAMDYISYLEKPTLENLESTLKCR